MTPELMEQLRRTRILSRLAIAFSVLAVIICLRLSFTKANVIDSEGLDAVMWDYYHGNFKMRAHQRPFIPEK